jgi:uncharacterized protein
VVVVYHPSFDLTLFTPPAGSIANGSVINFNGDDALTLERNGVGVVDQFGQIGFDPGTAWTTGDISTQDRTLQRRAGIGQGSAPPAAPAAWDLSLEWDALPINTFGGLGAR